MPTGSDPQMYGKKRYSGSVAFVPSIVGLIIGGEVVKDLAAKQK